MSNNNDNNVLSESNDLDLLDKKFTEKLEKLELKYNNLENEGNKRFTKLFTHLQIEPFVNNNSFNENNNNQNNIIIKSLLIALIVCLVNHKISTKILNNFTNDYISLNLLRIVIVFCIIYLTLILL